MAAKAKTRKKTAAKRPKTRAGKSATKRATGKVKPAIVRTRTVPDMVGAVTV